MTARLAWHADVAARAPEVLDRLIGAGVDVESVSELAGDVARDLDPLVGVREGHVDLAVVGLRALRGTAADALSLLAVLPRDEPRDVLLSLDGRPLPLRSLRRGTRVGVHGARRASFLRAHRRDLEVVEIPASAGAGLPDDSAGLGAAIMSAGEARRAGLSTRIGEMLDPRSWPPEPGQGAVALIARHPIAEVTALDHLPTRTALRAELALLDALDSPRDAALGCLAQPSGRLMRLWAAAASRDGKRVVRADLTGPLDEPQLLGAAVARTLSKRGSERVLTPTGT